VGVGGLAGLGSAGRSPKAEGGKGGESLLQRRRRSAAPCSCQLKVTANSNAHFKTPFKSPFQRYAIIHRDDSGGVVVEREETVTRRCVCGALGHHTAHWAGRP
jgi:hypothetical protein